MDVQEFNKLKPGDRVKTVSSGEATVIKTGIKDVHNGEQMVRLKCDKTYWACPYFFRSEISKKI